jgi:uncharacterized protein (DUF697 family)
MAAYREIQSTANSNMMVQGASALFGGAIAWGVDVMVIGTHYVPMFNKIRGLYGRGVVDKGVISPIISNILSECLFDLVHDKFLGGIPVIGVYFNAVCAKTLTWRLGILFSMLASRGEEIYADTVKDCMFVIRSIFPQSSAYVLAQPNSGKFKEIVMSVNNNTKQEFESKINKAVDAFR